MRILLMLLLMAGCASASIRPTDTNFSKETGIYSVNRQNAASLAYLFEALTPGITVKLPPKNVSQDMIEDNNRICAAQFRGTLWLGGVYKDGTWNKRLCAWEKIGRLRALNYCNDLKFQDQNFELKSFEKQKFSCTIIEYEEVHRGN